MKEREKLYWTATAAAFALGACLACGKGGAKPAETTAAKAPVHEHHAPHGGSLVELGEGEFAHLELLLDPAQGTLTGYSLDGEAENPIRLKQDQIVLLLRGVKGPGEFTLPLAARANSLTGETVGDTSEFSGRSDLLKNATTFTGRILSISTKGQKFDAVEFEFPARPDEDKK